MKTLIYQYYSGGSVPRWAHISIAKFKEYAARHDSEYLFSSEAHTDNHYFGHTRLLYDPLFEKYDKVLYVDVDIIPENMKANIFEEDIEDVGAVPEYNAPGLLAVPYYALPGVEKRYRKVAPQFDLPVVKPTSVEGATYLMFNSGVLLYSHEGMKKARDTFLHWKQWNRSTRGSIMPLDQTYITGQITKNLKYTELNLKWNCFPRYKFHENQFPAEINFIHYTGGTAKKELIEELYG